MKTNKPRSLSPRKRDTTPTIRERHIRRQHWLLLTGLLPPEERGFVPIWDRDLVFLNRAARKENAAQAKRYEEEYSKRIEESNRIKPIVQLTPLGEANRADKSDYPRKPTWSLPARPDDAPPSWDNVVRAYEEWLG